VAPSLFDPETTVIAVLYLFRAEFQISAGLLPLWDRDGAATLGTAPAGLRTKSLKN